MSADEPAHAAPHGRPLDARTVGVIIVAAVLVGLGLSSLAYWLITGRWLLLAGVIPLAVGGLLLFSRLSGPDRA